MGSAYKNANGAASVRTWRNGILMGLTALIVVALLVYALMPRPVVVDTAIVKRQPMRVTVDEDGMTRVTERYVVSAPLTGQLRRITLDPGDTVVAGQTVLATIVPPDPSLLDPRAQAEAQARVEAAAASQQQAETNVKRAAAELASVRSDLQRIQHQFERDAATQKELDDARLLVQVREQDHQSAQWAEKVAGHELALARAALMRTQPNNVAPADRRCRSFRR